MAHGDFSSVCERLVCRYCAIIDAIIHAVDAIDAIIEN